MAKNVHLAGKYHPHGEQYTWCGKKVLGGIGLDAFMETDFIHTPVVTIVAITCPQCRQRLIDLADQILCALDARDAKHDETKALVGRLEQIWNPR